MFFTFQNSDLNMLFLIKPLLEGLKRRYNKLKKKNVNRPDTNGKKCNLLVLSKIMFSGCYELLKKEQISNFKENLHNFFFKFIVNRKFLLYLMRYIAHQQFM